MSHSRPLNIALLRRSIIPANGGAEKVAANFLREFLRRGHRITFFGENIDPDTAVGIEWIKVPKTGLASSGTTRFHRNVQPLLEQRRHYFDIVYTMCRTYPADVFRVTEQLHLEWLPRNYPRPLQLLPRHRSILKLEKAMFDADHIREVVVNSELVRQQVMADYHFPAGRITRIPNGVDHRVFFPAAPEEKSALRRELDWPEEQQVLLFAAANFRTKRLDLAIRAAARLEDEQKKQLLLAVVGGDHPAPYRRLAENAGIAIRFVGKAAAMRRYYAAADLFYYPAAYEPFANVCLEAAACGLPVLTTRLNGSAELVTPGVSGYVVDRPEDGTAIQSALADFLTRTAAARQHMATEIHTAAVDYTWDRHADMLEQLFFRIRRSP
ncbi:MAG: glycosyltransferase family 4 protein [Victivallales bacterium]|nr:glycosyltransferase family 4 protein [Victivallales bacterium]